MNTLTDALQAFQAGEVSSDRFYAQVCLEIDRLLRREYGLRPEERAEILSDFYPRLRRLVTEYKSIGSTFDAYLASTLRYHCRSRHRTEQARRSREVLIDSWDELGFCAHEEPIDVLHGCPDEETLILSNSRRRDAVRKQLLICICKNVPSLTREEIECCARTYGLPLTWLLTVDEFVSNRRARVSAVRTRYRELRDQHYAAMLACGRQAEPRRIRTAAFHRRRWEFYRERLARQSVQLTNEEVSIILGIPKGTVDSSLHALSHRLAGRDRNQVVSPDESDTAIVQQRA